ncbi:MAG: MBOAT family protein [Bacteroidia bacterium]|nr:MBOAT family protein [Bacteroidia bacterium]
MDFLKSILFYREDSPLLFSSIYFWGFFLFIYIFYCVIYKKNKWRNIYLFAMSLFFYYKSGGGFVGLLVFSTLMGYSLGILIGKASSKLKKKLYVTLCVIVNLCILSYFKYAYFIIDSINQIFHTNFQVVDILAQCTNAITGAHFNVSDIILPVGISFFIFQSLSYIFDVYSGKLAPVTRILDFSFYITFFPQLVAGPIVRATEFFPQIYQDYKLTVQQFGHALFLILSGLVKKMVISDYISLNYVDRIFENPLSYTGFENLMGVYGYAIQIYCDFSGYTDIAIGVALLLGITLPLNFNSPYKAKNITDFWRRWHISLSNWFRDYLFLPAAYAISGKLKKNRYLFVKTENWIYLKATLITFLICGLWHGAHIRYLIWGGLHGIGLAAHRIWTQITPFKKRKNASRKYRHLFKFISVFITFHFVVIAWIYFRAADTNSVNVIFYKIFFDFHWHSIWDVILAYKIPFALILAAFIIHWLPSSLKEFYRGAFIKSPVYIKALTVVLMVIIIYQAKSSAIQPFIYFQF